jgi:hypothetical protein
MTGFGWWRSGKLAAWQSSSNTLAGFTGRTTQNDIANWGGMTLKKWGGQEIGLSSIELKC